MHIDRIKLIAEMARQNITAIELANKAGVSRSSIQSLRSGKSCNKTTVGHVAKALGLEIKDLEEV